MRLWVILKRPFAGMASPVMDVGRYLVLSISRLSESLTRSMNSSQHHPRLLTTPRFSILGFFPCRPLSLLCNGKRGKQSNSQQLIDESLSEACFGFPVSEFTWVHELGMIWREGRIWKQTKMLLAWKFTLNFFRAFLSFMWQSRPNPSLAQDRHIKTHPSGHQTPSKSPRQFQSVPRRHLQIATLVEAPNLSHAQCRPDHPWLTLEHGRTAAQGHRYGNCEGNYFVKRREVVVAATPHSRLNRSPSVIEY